MSKKTTKQKMEEILELKDPQTIIEKFQEITLDEVGQFRNKLFWKAVEASIKRSQREITEQAEAKAWMKYNWCCELEDIRMKQ